MACGCRFQPYYPITPASDESVFLESNEIIDVRDNRPGSTLVVQTEDEISAIGMTIGGALTGTRSATCTSGPGFSLMSEALGWAGINEVPIVITLYQRSGPSTGLPTRHGQDDLLSTIYAGHGEFPRIVYASGDVEESFYDTAKCFNYSEQYQMPVIHMMDKFLASSVVTCKKFDTGKITINRGKLLEKLAPDANYKRFAFTDDGISPRSKIGLENGIFWNTGDESDEAGHITEDPELRIKMMDKRQSKLDRILKTMPDEDQAVSFGVEQTCVVSWGSPKGPILDAIQMLKNENIEIGFIQIKLLHPFPKDYLGFLLKDVKTIIDVEANHVGQLGELLKQNLQRTPDYYVLKYTGRTMTSTEIYHSIKNIIENKAKTRQVLTHGA
jgi:2-oxoglutarate ferredoxin oxidoreductase subunit alpha